MTDVHDIEETFRHLAGSVEVPPPDEVAFRRRVRRARAGRIGFRAVAACAATAVVLGGALTVTRLVGAEQGGRPADVPVAASVQGVAAENRPPVYLSIGGRLAALDAAGDVHRLGARVQEILGSSPDGVLVVDLESHLVRFRAVEGPAGWRFKRAKPPLEDSVQAAVVSTTPGLVAWVTLDDEVVTYDLEHERVVDKMPAGPETRLFDVGRGVLVSEDDTPVLHEEGRTTELPTSGGWVRAMDSAQDTVAVSVLGDDGLRTYLYRLASDRLLLLDVVPGSGALSPDGSTYAAAPDEEQDAEPVLWTRGQPLRSLTGLGGPVTGMAWLDDDTAAVTTVEPQTSRAGMAGSRVYTCEVGSGACELALTSGRPVVTLRY